MMGYFIWYTKFKRNLYKNILFTKNKQSSNMLVMSDINSPEFKRRASEAAANRIQADGANQVLRNQQDAEVCSRQEATRHQEEELRTQVDKERVLGRELAKLAIQRGISTNRSWVTAYRSGIGVIRWLQKGTVLEEGWMLFHKDTSAVMDTGEIDLYGYDLTLTTAGNLYVDGRGHSSKIDDPRTPYGCELAHPQSHEYMDSLRQQTAGNTPWGVFNLEDVQQGLAEFAGLNRLV